MIFRPSIGPNECVSALVGNELFATHKVASIWVFSLTRRRIAESPLLKCDISHIIHGDPFDEVSQTKQ